MWKVLATLVLFFALSSASAHEDRILPILSDGTISDLPATFGRVKVSISRASSSQKIEGVQLSGLRFKTRLNPCLLKRVASASHIEASGSWYHDLRRSPPYVSLNFYMGEYDFRRYNNEYYSVTFSLIDGHILSGLRTWDPWWGKWRGQYIKPADKCSNWSGVP
jgi:hypothetical protein